MNLFLSLMRGAPTSSSKNANSQNSAAGLRRARYQASVLMDSVGKSEDLD